VLGFSSWGTGGNNFGQSLAMAKIVAAAEARASGDGRALARVRGARKQLVIEAIAHDVFFIGYEKGASGATVGDGRANPLSAWIRERGLPLAPGQRLTEGQLVELYREASRHATAELEAKYPNFTGRVQFVPQPFNRRFEASTLYSEGTLPVAGSVSSELVAKYPELGPARTYRAYAPARPGGRAVGSNGKFFDP
jgi:hypothetical protein